MQWPPLVDVDIKAHNHENVGHMLTDEEKQLRSFYLIFLEGSGCFRHLLQGLFPQLDVLCQLSKVQEITLNLIYVASILISILLQENKA